MPTHGEHHKIGKDILNMYIIVKTNNESKIMNEDKGKKIGFNVAKRKSTNFCVDISLAMSANEKDISF
jgi:hypothetical protein